MVNDEGIPAWKVALAIVGFVVMSVAIDLIVVFGKLPDTTWILVMWH